MINTKRIVPVQKSDLLSIIGTMFKIAGTSITKVSASAPGVFALTSGSGNVLADEPVISMDFGAAVTSITVYFIPAVDFDGFSISGTAATFSGTLDADGATLYSATLSTGTITVAKVAL